MTTCDIRNNIVNITGTAKGQGTIVAIRRNSIGTVNTKPAALTLQNNILNVNAAANNWLYAEGNIVDTGTFINAFATSNVNADPAHNLVLDNGFNTPCSQFKLFMAGAASGTFQEDNLVANGDFYTPVGASFAKQNAAPITSPAITTDLSGATRDANPDDGALEFAGGTMDGNGPSINFSPLANQNCVNSPALSINITDPSGVNTNPGTSPRLYYKKAVNANNISEWRYVEANNTSAPFNFNIDYTLLSSLPVNGDAIQYFVISQDMNGYVATDNIAFPTGVCPASVALPPGAFPVSNYKTFTIAATPSIAVNATTATICPGIADTFSTAITRNGNAVVGNGNTSSVVSCPYMISGSAGRRLQIIYSAADLKAAGLTAGNITSVAFNVSSVGTPGYSIANFTIKLAPTFLNALTSTFESDAPMTTVFTGTVTPVVGINTHTFTTPFAWDGTSNLIMQICYSPSGYTSSIQTTQTAVGNIVVNQISTGATCATTTGTTNGNRPNTTFSGVTLANTSFATFTWNDGTANVGPSNDSLTIVPPFPAGNTMNYSVMADDGAGCTLTGNTSITRYASPIALTPTTPSNTCAGNAVALNAAVAATWSPATGLYNEAGASTAYANNATNGVYALLHNNQYVSASYNNGTCTFKDSVLVTVPSVNGTPAVANNSGASNTDSAYISGVTQFHNADCELMATITPNGAAPVTGLVNATITMDASVQAFAGAPFITRHYEIKPNVNGASATAAVKLYFTQAEFDTYNSYVTSNGLGATYPLMPTNPTSATNNIFIHKYEGAGATPAVNTGVSSPALTSVVWNAASNVWEVSLNVTGFSTFYLNSNGSNPLPIAFENFTAKAVQQNNLLSWTMGDKTQGTFSILHSNDGRNFESVGSLETNTGNTYSFEHKNPEALEMYQIQLKDNTGKVYSSNTQMVQRNDKKALAVALYPNPTVSNAVTLHIKNASQSKVAYVITDVLGKEVLSGNIVTSNGNADVSINISSLNNGIYNVKLLDGQDQPVRRLVIAN